MNRLQKNALAVLVVLALGFGDWSRVSAVQITLHDGRVLKGRLGKLKAMGDMGKGLLPSNVVTPIVFLNDELRRTYFPQRQVLAIDQENAEVHEKITVRQVTLKGGRIVHALGPIIEITPFDEFGRRTFSMNSPQGRLDIVQGITLITPTYTKVEGMKHVWDMRIATSSIPPEIFGKILAQQAKIKAKETKGRENEIEDRKGFARFYLQCEWYEKASAELDALVTATRKLKQTFRACASRSKR